MKQTVIYCPIENKALSYAAAFLQENHIPVLSAPEERVTHLLLPVPSFSPDGTIKGGGDLETVLSVLPKSITVIGGNLHHPALAGYSLIDLLQDPIYTAENAGITAHCAVKLLSSCLPCILKDLPVLLIGWGRIGKLTARLLRANGAAVTVCARKESDRGLLTALGYSVQSAPDPTGFRVVINTAPAPVLDSCPDGVLKIELSSVLGIGGNNVLWARGLPGIQAPESSGKLIGQSILRLIKEVAL